MIDLVLINPITSFLEDEFYMPNMTTILLQGWLRQQLPDKKIVVINLAENNNNYSTIPEANAYGISFTTPHVPEVLKIRQYLKQTYLESLVIGGGPHVSALPYDTLQKDLCDVVVRGAGEIPLKEFLTWGNSSSFIDKKSCIPTMDTDYILRQCMFNIPPDIHSYDEVTLDYSILKREYKVWLIMNDYGCVHDCNFCYKMQTGVYKFSEQFILNQIEQYQGMSYKAQWIKFSSDNICTHFKSYVNVFKKCAEYDIPYEVVARLDMLKQPQLELLKATGCKIIKVGLESASERILGLMNKREKLSDMQGGFELLEQVGIPYGVYLIAGYPTETMEEVRNTVEFVNKLKVSYIGISDYTVYPGSPDWYKLENSIREKMMVDFGNVHHLGKLNTVDKQSHKGYMLQNIKKV